MSADFQSHLNQGLGAWVRPLKHQDPQQGLELQTQAFRQISGAHARRLQALEQRQGHGEVVHHLLQLRGVFTGQAFGQRGQRVFQVAIVIEGFDQEAQRGAVFWAQAQGQGLAVQMALQGLLGARHLGDVSVLIAVQVVVVGLGIAPPLAVIGRQRSAAIAFPALPIVR